MATKKPADSGEIHIIEVNTGTITVAILGRKPLILNRLSEKAKRELLLPAPKKTAADKASKLKHDPIEEFRAAPVTLRDDAEPTLLAMPATAFKQSMRTAALDMSGITKTQAGRLLFVDTANDGEKDGIKIAHDNVPIYGVPKVYTTIVRSADINRTPDVRTRCIVPRWAAVMSITFVKPIMREQSVANLLAAAGITVGVGDYRAEKGAGNYGSFELVGMDDKRLVDIMTNGTRAAQVAAMADPEAYDEETEELLAWFNVEVRRRGFKVAA